MKGLIYVFFIATLLAFEGCAKCSNHTCGVSLSSNGEYITTSGTTTTPPSQTSITSCYESSAGQHTQNYNGYVYICN